LKNYGGRIFIQTAKRQAKILLQHYAIVLIVNTHLQILKGQLIKELLQPQKVVLVLTVYLMLINFGELLLVIGSDILVVGLIQDNHYM
jgi:hypothetical protein